MEMLACNLILIPVLLTDYHQMKAFHFIGIKKKVIEIYKNLEIRTVACQLASFKSMFICRLNYSCG